MVVFLDKGVEATLLPPQGGCSRPGGSFLESFVHPFMSAILLGAARFDQLGIDAEADPPDRQPREPAKGSRGKGCAIVGADDVRQTILLEGAEKYSPGVLIAGADQ